MNKEVKAAKRFARRLGNVNLKTVSNYLNEIGYVVFFYNKNEENELIDKYKMTAYSKTVHAFTIKTKGIKAVFIDSGISVENKLHSMLHETAHIVMGHLDENNMIVDSRLQEMQAEAFAYEVLKYNNPFKKIVIAVFLCAFCALGIFDVNLLSNEDVVSGAVHNKQTDDLIDNKMSDGENAEKVYITRTGKKYHLKSCRYVKGKTNTSLTRENAKINYEPCKVCKP